MRKAINDVIDEADWLLRVTDVSEFLEDARQDVEGGSADGWHVIAAKCEGDRSDAESNIFGREQIE